ncbi:4-amino-4-deoxychorismate lyase [Modicisalibacter muralis]|uniref:Aminodeoxychorismate lyase n=1 Tax=Modicisalibacter muralis TaxID=119000 RepID=A0A1G9MBD8_9GAMM|nr:aminodeoxychorismate lyase [Halomonas muralis]SDL71519.1 4-amino-4-deoxychorismate lyase [Halomonas muralis]
MHDTVIPFDDRGFAYGDGLFETVLVRDGEPLLWEAHMERLARGCVRLGFVGPERAMLDTLPAQAGQGLHVLKLVVTRGRGGRGYLPPADPQPSLRWQFSAFAPHQERWREGIRVRLCRLRLAIQPCLAGLKHLNRLENVLARQEWNDPDIAEGLLCDSAGRLVEATCMNLFWQRDGRWETPRLDACGVAGTLRAALLAERPIAEVAMDTDELAGVDALWLGNSVQGVWPVARLDDAEGNTVARWPITAIHRPLQNAGHALLGYPGLAD